MKTRFAVITKYLIYIENKSSPFSNLKNVIFVTVWNAATCRCTLCLKKGLNILKTLSFALQDSWRALILTCISFCDGSTQFGAIHLPQRYPLFATIFWCSCSRCIKRLLRILELGSWPYAKRPLTHTKLRSWCEMAVSHCKPGTQTLCDNQIGLRDEASLIARSFPLTEQYVFLIGSVASVKRSDNTNWNNKKC